MKKIISLLIVFQLLICQGFTAPVIEDEFVNQTLKNNTKQIQCINKEESKNVNYDPKSIVPIAISITEYATTRKDLFEGQELNFIVAKDVIVDGKTIIKQGEKVVGRVELLQKNGPFGNPANLTVGNFKLENGKSLIGEINKTGANRAYWIYPVGVLSILFFLLGLLVLTIRGGHAKIKPKQQYKLDYAQVQNL